MVAQQLDINQFTQQVVASLVQSFGYTTDNAQLSVRSSQAFIRESCVNDVKAVDVAGMIACEDANTEEAAKAPTFDDEA